MFQCRVSCRKTLPKRNIRVDYVVRTVLVLAVVVMVNYLGARWYHRSYLSSQTRQPLSPLTVGLLRSLTNHIKVTLLYDKEDPLFTTVSALLGDYHNANPRLSVTAVDYRWDAAEAENVKNKYASYFINVTNIIIFDCDGRVKVVNGNALAEYTIEFNPVPNDPDEKWRRKPVAFLGEKCSRPPCSRSAVPAWLKAYFLTGHGEHALEDGAERATCCSPRCCIRIISVPEELCRPRQQYVPGASATCSSLPDR